MSERPEGSHEAVVVDSTDHFIAHLDGLRRQALSDALRSAINDLVTSLAAAMVKRRGLVPSDVPFTTRSLKDLSSAERELLVNQWSLGVGNPSARVIVMGTEHADDVNGDWPAGLAVESCANAILWLADDRGPLAAHIADDRTWASARGRGYHRHPYDYYRVGGGHTWRVVAKVAGASFDRLGDETYQIERSAAPARTAARGRPPTPERVALLLDLLARSSARVLLLHGHAVDPPAEWEVVNSRLIDQFLNRGPRTVHDHSFGANRARTMDAGERRVVLAPPLNGRVRGLQPDARDAIGRLVQAAAYRSFRETDQHEREPRSGR